eukprot:Gb_19606 [translate_table: standard]
MTSLDDCRGPRVSLASLQPCTTPFYRFHGSPINSKGCIYVVICLLFLENFVCFFCAASYFGILKKYIFDVFENQEKEEQQEKEEVMANESEQPTEQVSFLHFSFPLFCYLPFSGSVAVTGLETAWKCFQAISGMFQGIGNGAAFRSHFLLPRMK